MAAPVFSKTLKRIQSEFRMMHSFLINDPLVKETLFTSNSRLFTVLRTTNLFFSFVVFIPIIASFWNFNLPSFLGYILCAFVVYLTWIFELVTKSIILEEIRTFTIVQVSLHSVFGIWLGFYGKFHIYDFILHLTGGMWLVFLIYPIVIGIELLSTDSKNPFFYFKIVIITLVAVTALGAFWEIGEFVSDLIFRNYPGYRLAQEDSLFDTMTDILANLIGTIAGMEIFWTTLKKLNKYRDMDLLFQRMGRALKDYINNMKK
ncbi:MAG TPA: hypothetical protein PLY22_00030 [Fervidobacterium sp.]|nr:hypothetical protein [Fervidobacterium sp.]HPV62306.1 hypothetical protein [Fervidobacterium sp.]